MSIHIWYFSAKLINDNIILGKLSRNAFTTLINTIFLIALCSTIGHASANHTLAENTGWLNLRSNHGGISVQNDHFKGYVWPENIEWISFGSDSGRPNAKTNANNWGGNSNPDWIVSG